MIPESIRSTAREALAGSRYAIRSYAQEGEDILLLRLLEGIEQGVYVDVGAHHPYRFSNTCLLHERGWRGINIDAMPGSMAAFRRRRPGDVNLEIGVGATPASLRCHLFEEAALNTFDDELAREREAQGWKKTATRVVDCLPLRTILERELPRLDTSSIDLLSVDAEGFDLQVLRSSDWERYRPRAVVAEVLDVGIDDMLSSDVARFLAEVGYRPYAKLVNSAVFLRSE